MSLQKLFQKTLFGIFFLFGMIGVATSVLCIRTVDSYLSREYEANSKGIAKTIADASVDIILNRNLSLLQSLIDQFVEIQGISYIYITDEFGEFLAHTFVPGIPEEIRVGYTGSTDTVERRLPRIGDAPARHAPGTGRDRVRCGQPLCNSPSKELTQHVQQEIVATCAGAVAPLQEAIDQGAVDTLPTRDTLLGEVPVEHAQVVLFDTVLAVQRSPMFQKAPQRACQNAA